MTNHINSTRNVQVEVIDRPLLTIRPDVVILDETEKMLFLAFHVDMLHLSLVLKRIIRPKGSVTEIVLRLLVHKRTHLTGQFTYPRPLFQRFLNGNAILLPLPLGCGLSIETFKEISNQQTNRQKPFTTFISVDMLLWLKVDVLVLFVKPCIRKGLHFLFHRLRSDHLFSLCRLPVCHKDTVFVCKYTIIFLFMDKNIHIILISFRKNGIFAP